MPLAAERELEIALSITLTLLVYLFFRMAQACDFPPQTGRILLGALVLVLWVDAL